MIEQLKTYITTELITGSLDAPLTADTPLIENGILDSLGIFKLLSFIEEQFSIRVDPTEIVYENFASLNTIQQMIQRTKNQP